MVTESSDVLAQSDLVKACPRCGNIVLVNCWHPDTEEISSIWMDAHKARMLRRWECVRQMDHMPIEEGDFPEEMFERFAAIQQEMTKHVRFADATLKEYGNKV